MKSLKLLFIAAAYLMIFVIMLASTHAKDIASHITAQTLSKSVATVRGHGDDSSTKVSADLHNHTEKTSLKAFAKVAYDQAVIARQRETKSVFERIEHTFTTTLLEFMLMFRLSVAYAFVR